MRRSTRDCSFVGIEQRKVLARLEGLDTEAIARLLEVHATDERRARFEGVFAARLDSVTVLMDAPHDPHNGAAVIRSCDAFGVQRLHIVERREEFLASNTVARGSERWVEVRTYRDNETVLRSLAASNHTLVATHPDGDLEPDALKSIPRVALVLGNERDGIHAGLEKACSHAVRIPMRGFAESLNVSVTAAILIERATSGRPGDLSAEERTRLYARALLLSVPRAAEILAERRPELLLAR